MVISSPLPRAIPLPQGGAYHNRGNLGRNGNRTGSAPPKTRVLAAESTAFPGFLLDNEKGFLL